MNAPLSVGGNLVESSLSDPEREQWVEPVWFDPHPLPENLQASIDAFPLEDLVDLVVERCSSTVFSQHTEDTEFVGRLRESVAQNAYALREVLAGRADPEHVKLDHVLSFATVQAQLHIPQKLMQRSYRVSFYTQWEAWTRHLRLWIRSEGLDADKTASALSMLTRRILTYQDHVASRVAEAYTRDYEALNRSRAHVRRNLVREVLRGEAGELSASDRAILGYPLDAHHVVVFLPDMTEGAASRLADGLRSASSAHQTLVQPLTLASTAVWLGKMEPWTTSRVQSLVQVLDKVAVTASVSDPNEGVDGFSRSLKQAQDTERVRSAWGRSAPQVMRYADAGLEILLMQDADLARSFVTAELGPLAADTAEAARLRETLDASFRFGSHVAAAQHLNLHEHTVRNRLHKAESLLGHPLQERRTELQVAVRLLRLLGSDD
jgi:DNA-binding PucR family transcriptional regulator